MKEKEVKKTAKTTKKKDDTVVEDNLTDNSVKKMNIYEKMLAITDEMGIIGKNLDVQGKYKAVAEKDVLDRVKELEKKYRIYSYPYLRSQNPIANLASKVTMRVDTVYRFVNIDNPEEYLDITSYGDGVDTLDKAPGKAMTYADKYALMKAYKISTGDDPDQNPSPDVLPKPTVNNYVVNKPAEEEAKMITPEQIQKIESMISEERKARLLAVHKKNSLSEFDEAMALKFIKKLEKEAERNASNSENSEAQ